MSPYFQIITLAIVSLIILYKIKSNKSAILLSTIFALFTVLQVTSIYLTGNVINYRFYSHLNLDDVIQQSYQFIFEFFIFTSLFIFLAFLFYFASKKVKYTHKIKKRFLLPILLSLFVIMSLPSGVLSESYKIYEILSADEKSFEDALTDLEIPVEDYITPEQLNAVSGKNIIVISMESLEQGYLNSNFEGIIPNLKKLSNKFSFYNDMQENPGGSWTAASLYSHQVGIPAFFKGQGNDFFQGTTNVKLTGLGHVLNKAGYNSMYLVGNPEFAGTADILNAYSIPVISQHNSLGSYPETSSGLNDFDLFEEAKLQIANAEKQSKPFAIFMSTINTHFPAGIYDARMEQKVAKIEDPLEFSVSALDYLIGEFMDFLEKRGHLNDTAVFLFPDHLFMGTHGNVFEKLSRSKRQLYLITNVAENKLSKTTKETIYQIDLPRLILDGAEIKTNANFLSDFVKTKNMISYLTDNRAKITTLNTASLKRSDFKDGVSIMLSENNLFVSSSNKSIKFEVLEKNKEYFFDLTFNSEMVLLDKKNNEGRKYLFKLLDLDKQQNRIHLIIHINDELLTTYLGDKQRTGISYQEKNIVKYSEDEIQSIIRSSKNMTTFNPPELHDLAQKIVYDSSLVTVTSSEYVAMSYFRSQFKVGAKIFYMKRGLNILSNDKGFFEVEDFDTYGSESAAEAFITRLKTLVKNRSFFVVASNDAISNDYPEYKKKLELLGFNQLAKFTGRLAYIAHFNSSGKLQEYSSLSTLTYVIPSFKNVSSNYKSRIMPARISSYSVNKYSKDVNRFIAHAGGQIDGNRYTNSLNALNLSYKLGYRLFELDIIKTSDDIYVSAHDWEYWARVTGYEGSLPPSRKVFKEHKINGQYNSLDISDINKWFASHPDAILVTDKVNNALDFSSQFIDKNRLMMELFSLAAVKEGIKAKIKSAMPSWSVLSEITGDKVKVLKDMGVTAVAASRRVINEQESLLNSLNNAGIKIYAFYLNFDEGKNETHVVCNEMDYFYGIYADKWDFKSELDCG